MNFLKTFAGSSIGRKILVAVTGIMLILFIVGHMLGNLQIFLQPDWINSYAYKLQSLGPLLWVIRLSLLAIVAVHIWATISLTLENRKARPDRYAVNSPKASTLASRSMAGSGLIILAFIAFHLLHFTVRKVPGHEYQESIVLASGREIPAHVELTKHWGPKLAPMEPVQTHNTYGMMIAGFSYWYISGFYILAMFLLCLHLSHGAASLFQTLGLRNHNNGPGIELGARIFAGLIFAGFAIIPIAILAGIVKYP